LEKYLFVGLNQGIFIYMDGLEVGTAYKIIGNTLYDLSYWMVIYMKNTSSKNSVLNQEVLDNFDLLFRDL